jgi:site-specific recombinase XerD
MDIFITHMLKDTFELQKDYQDRCRNYFGNNYIKSGFMMTHEDGSPSTVDYYSKVFYKITDALELSRIRPHDMRHSVVTNLINSGARVKDVSELLGHANVETTLNI